MNAHLVLVSLFCIIWSCLAKKNGAPLEACPSMFPQHSGKSPQQSHPPYSVSAEKIEEGKYKVKISSPQGLPFEGFMLQARSALNKDDFIVGKFKASENSRAIDCNGHEKSALTHTNPQEKSDVITEWALSGLTGEEDIIFRATVARNYSAFWMDIDSEPIKMKTESKIPPPAKSPVDYDVCGELKKCIGLPEKCIENHNCQVLLTYEIKNGDIEFTMLGLLNESEYMAMGLSDDNKMGDDYVTECIRVGKSSVTLRNSWNEAKSNTRTTEPSGIYETGIVDGIARCTWIEPNVTHFNDIIYDFINKKYHILLAKGPVEKGALRYHEHKMMVASAEPIDFFEKNLSPDLDETKDDKKDPEGEITNEPEEKQTTKSNEDSKPHSKSSCSTLNSSLFYFTLLGIYAYSCLKSSVF